MEEELEYKTVVFYSNGVSVNEKHMDVDVVYDQVKTEERACDTTLVITGGKAKAPLCSQLHLVAASLGIICVILVSVVIALAVRLSSVTSERETENIRSQRQREDLIRERDRLNWTIGAILEYGACKPCLDHWVQFQSSCYFFSDGNLSAHWRTWRQSRDECRNWKADLVVIESKEEQEFISTQTRYYHDDKHGYWVGLIKKNTWMWLEKQELNVSYWRTDSTNTTSCGMNLHGNDPLTSWKNMGCKMKNRWICERRALIKAN